MGKLLMCYSSCGAWLGQTLEPPGFEVDVRPKSGNCVTIIQITCSNARGELDVIPFAGGKISVGASHENDQGFDLTKLMRLYLQVWRKRLSTPFP